MLPLTMGLPLATGAAADQIQLQKYCSTCTYVHAVLSTIMFTITRLVVLSTCRHVAIVAVQYLGPASRLDGEDGLV